MISRASSSGTPTFTRTATQNVFSASSETMRVSDAMVMSARAGWPIERGTASAVDRIDRSPVQSERRQRRQFLADPFFEDLTELAVMCVDEHPGVDPVHQVRLVPPHADGVIEDAELVLDLELAGKA